jgi:hypothetical protein
MSGAQRTSSSIGSIIVNVILLYVAQHLLEWHVPWFTPAWSDVLWAVNLSLEVSIAVNVLFLLVGWKWFHHLAGTASCAVAVLATWWIYVVFPFDFGDVAANSRAHLVILLVLAATSIGMLVNAVLGLVELIRAAAEPVAAHR